MRTLWIVLLMVCLVLATGCSGGGSTGTENGIPSPGQLGLQGQGSTPFALKNLSQPALLTNGSYAVTVSIDRIETDTSKPDRLRMDIYVKVENSGTRQVLPVWYSRVTDTRGVSHGGVGVSHGGAGAEGPLLDPGSFVVARDYVSLGSREDGAALAKGGTLDLVILGYNQDLVQVVTFRSTWALEPGVVR